MSVSGSVLNFSEKWIDCMLVFSFPTIFQIYRQTFSCFTYRCMKKCLAISRDQTKVSIFSSSHFNSAGIFLIQSKWFRLRNFDEKNHSFNVCLFNKQTNKQKKHGLYVSVFFSLPLVRARSPKDAKYNPIRIDWLVQRTVVCIQRKEEERWRQTGSLFYCWRRKSVDELAEVFVVVAAAFIVVVVGATVDVSLGFFITVTKPPNSSNRNGVELLLAQIS